MLAACEARDLASLNRSALAVGLAETTQTVDSVVIIDHGRLVTQSPLASLTHPR